MPKGKSSLPTLVVAGLVVGLVGYYLTLPQEQPKVNRAPVAEGARPSSSAGFDASDMDAHFVPVNLSEHNAFMPLVARRPSGLSGEVARDPSAVPTLFTGGETGWFYTGMVELDGATMALIENRSTGDGMYVSPGEAWKSARIVRVSSEGLVLSASMGQTVTLRLNDGSTMMEEEADLEGSAPAQVGGLTAVPEETGIPGGAIGMPMPVVGGD